MKIAFFLLVASGKYSNILNNIDKNIYFYKSGQIKGKNYESLVINNFCFLVHVSLINISYDIKSSSSNGNWDLLLLLPEKDDYDKSFNSFQRFNRIKRNNDKNYVNDKIVGYNIEGPMTLKTIERRLINVDLSSLYNESGELIIPHIFAGDPPPEVLAKIEYEPTDNDCDLEKIPLKSEVFINTLDKKDIDVLKLEEESN